MKERYKLLLVRQAHCHKAENSRCTTRSGEKRRSIVDRPAGTVTSFAFDEGQALSEHTAPYDALVLVTDGSVEIAIGGEPRTVSAGQGIIMPANVTHALKALTPFKMTLVMIRA